MSASGRKTTVSESPTTAATPQTVTTSLQQFGLARDRMRSALATGARISPADLDALEYLEAEGPLTQRQLGERLSLTSGAITMLVDRLEEAGWVRRGPHPSDRRYVLVELSAQALDRAPASLTAYHARIAALTADIPAAHHDVIARFLQAAADAAADAAVELRRAGRPSDMRGR
jgi:DNA-binding MarR family transcriptional regulator